MLLLFLGKYSFQTVLCTVLLFGAVIDIVLHEFGPQFPLFLITSRLDTPGAGAALQTGNLRLQIVIVMVQGVTSFRNRLIYNRNISFFTFIIRRVQFINVRTFTRVEGINHLWLCLCCILLAVKWDSQKADNELRKYFILPGVAFS